MIHTRTLTIAAGLVLALVGVGHAETWGNIYGTENLRQSDLDGDIKRCRTYPEMAPDFYSCMRLGGWVPIRPGVPPVYVPPPVPSVNPWDAGWLGASEGVGRALQQMQPPPSINCTTRYGGGWSQTTCR